LAQVASNRSSFLESTAAFSHFFAMVKTLFFVISTSVATDSVCLLQAHTAVRTVGQRVIAALSHEGKDTICVQATAGDISPIVGSFTAGKSQQAVEVAAGAVAQEDGSFCVSKQDMLLVQRSHGLTSAHDFDAALEGKKSTPGTPDDAASKKGGTAPLFDSLPGCYMNPQPTDCASEFPVTESCMTDDTQFQLCCKWINKRPDCTEASIPPPIVLNSLPGCYNRPQPTDCESEFPEQESCKSVTDDTVFQLCCKSEHDEQSCTRDSDTQAS